MTPEGDSTSNFGLGGQGPVKWCPSNFERWVGPRQILSRRWAPWGGRLSLCESVKFRAVGPSKADERATTTMSMLQRSTTAAPCAAQQARTAALLRRRTDHSHHADQPCAAGAWKTSLAAPHLTRFWATLHTDHSGPLSSIFSRSSLGLPSNFSRSSGPSVKLWPP